MGNNDSIPINSNIVNYTEPVGDPLLEHLKGHGRKSMNSIYGEFNNTVYMEFIRYGYFSYPLKHYKKLSLHNHINSIGATLYIYTFMYNFPILRKMLENDIKCNKNLFHNKITISNKNSTFLPDVDINMIPLYLDHLLFQYNNLNNDEKKCSYIHEYIDNLTHDVIYVLNINKFPEHNSLLISLLNKIISPDICFDFTTTSNQKLISNILQIQNLNDEACLPFLSNYIKYKLISVTGCSFDYDVDSKILDATVAREFIKCFDCNIDSEILDIIIMREFIKCFDYFIHTCVIINGDASEYSPNCNYRNRLECSIQVKILNMMEKQISKSSLSQGDFYIIQTIAPRMCNYISIQSMSDNNTHLINICGFVNAPDSILMCLGKELVDKSIKFKHMFQMFDIMDKLGYNEQHTSYYYKYMELQEISPYMLLNMGTDEEIYRGLIKYIEANNESYAMEIINSDKFNSDSLANYITQKDKFVSFISDLIMNSHVQIIKKFLSLSNCSQFKSEFSYCLALKISSGTMVIPFPTDQINDQIKEILTQQYVKYLTHISRITDKKIVDTALSFITTNQILSFIATNQADWGEFLQTILKTSDNFNFIKVCIDETINYSYITYELMCDVLEKKGLSDDFIHKVLFKFTDIADFSQADNIIRLHSQRFPLNIQLIDFIVNNIRSSPNTDKNVLLNIISKYYTDEDIILYIKHLGNEFDPNHYTNTFQILYTREKFKSIKVFIENGLTDIYQPEIMASHQLYKIKSNYLLKQILITACSALESYNIILLMLKSSDVEICDLCEEIVKNRKLSTNDVKLLVDNSEKIQSSILIDAIINNNHIVRNSNRTLIQLHYTTIPFPYSIEEELGFIALVLDVNKKNHPEFVKYLIKNHTKFLNDSYDVYEGILSAIIPRSAEEWINEGYMNVVCSSHNRIAFQIGMACKIITDQNQTDEFIDMILEQSSIEFLCDFIDKVPLDQFQFFKGLGRNNISNEQLNIILDSNKLNMNIQFDEYMQLSELIMHKILYLDEMYIPDLIDKLVMIYWPVIMYDIYKIFSLLIDRYEDLIFYICIKLFVKDDEGYALLEYDINQNDNRDICVYNCLNNKSEELALTIMQTGKCNLGNSTIMGIQLTPSPLMIILTKGYEAILNYVIQTYKIKNISIDGSNVLSIECKIKNYSLIRNVIANTPKEEKDSLNLSEQFLASINEGDLDFVKICIKENLFDIKHTDEIGDSYFAIACKCGKDEIAIKLLEAYNEIDAHQENNNGKTAIDYAIENNLEQTKSAILKHKPSISRKTETISGGECAICLDDEVEENNNICTYVFEPCHHSFDIHDQCLISYKKNTKKCVSCRAPITKMFKIFRQSAS